MTDIVMTESAARGASEPVPFTSRQFRDAMGQFATGVVVISTELDGEIHAMTANAFMSGSLEPPLVLVSVAKTARMHDRLEKAGRFGISVLTKPQLQVSNHFSGRPSADFQPTFSRICDMPVIDGAAVQLAAKLHHAYACGDHTLYVGLVQELQRPGEAEPLLYHAGRYAALESGNN
ncbi:flavin reductase family protein [Massilia horti]|nr:flavin reductase family protein [Massilia horti]